MEAQSLSLKFSRDGASRPFTFAIWDEMPEPNRYIVRVSGEFDLAAKPRFAEVMEAVRSGRPEEIVVDLCDCELIDSTAMKELVAAGEAALAGAVVFSVSCPGGPVRRLIEMSGIDRRLKLLPAAA